MSEYAGSFVERDVDRHDKIHLVENAALRAVQIDSAAHARTRAGKQKHFDRPILTVPLSRVHRVEKAWQRDLGRARLGRVEELPVDVPPQHVADLRAHVSRQAHKRGETGSHLRAVAESLRTVTVIVRHVALSAQPGELPDRLGIDLAYLRRFLRDEGGNALHQHIESRLARDAVHLERAGHERIRAFVQRDRAVGVAIPNLAGILIVVKQSGARFATGYRIGLPRSAARTLVVGSRTRSAGDVAFPQVSSVILADENGSDRVFEEEVGIVQVLLDDDLHERHHEGRVGSGSRPNPHIGLRRDERIIRIDHNELRALLLAGEQVRHSVWKGDAGVQPPHDIGHGSRRRGRHALGHVVHVVAPYLLMPERHRIVGRRNDGRPLHDVEQTGQKVTVLGSVEQSLTALSGEHARNAMGTVFGRGFLDLIGYLGDRLFP